MGLFALVRIGLGGRFNENLNPGTGKPEVWRIVRSWIFTETTKLQGDLMASHISHAEILPEVLVDESNLMDSPFMGVELEVILNACKVKTSSGLDGICYEFIRGFSSGFLDFIYLLYNRMFSHSVGF